MAKEPKLLADIRASKARAEKAAKDAPPSPRGPMATGHAVTLENPNPPDNYLTKALAECTTAAHCDELLAHAKQHGYSEDGQTVPLIRAKRAQFRDRNKDVRNRGRR